MFTYLLPIFYSIATVHHQVRAVNPMDAFVCRIWH